jgi:hypothetical protein
MSAKAGTDMMGRCDGEFVVEAEDGEGVNGVSRRC